mgnify:CR=1 FL=1
MTAPATEAENRNTETGLRSAAGHRNTETGTEEVRLTGGAARKSGNPPAKSGGNRSVSNEARTKE